MGAARRLPRGGRDRHEGAVRETLEETGLIVEPGQIVGLYSRLEAAVVVITYEARIVGGRRGRATRRWRSRPSRPDAIPWSGLGLTTSVWALRDWLALRHPHLEPGPTPLGAS